MAGNLIEYPVLYPANGIMTRGVLIYQEAPEPSPAVLVNPGAGGMGEGILEVGRRLADRGFAALVVDLYSSTPERDLPSEKTFSNLLPFFRDLDERTHLICMDEGLNYLASLPTVRADRIGVLGFCAAFPIIFACQNPRLRACVSFYNVMRYTERTKADLAVAPIDRIANLWCPWIGHYGDQDTAISLEQLKELEELGGKYQKKLELHIYEGCAHGFVEPRSENYHPEAAETAWSRTFAFLAKHLKG